MGNETRWWERWRGGRSASPASGVRAMQPAAAAAAAAARSVDVELIIRAARLAVTTRTATKPAFVRRLEVSDDVADQLLRKLEHCEVIAGDEPGRPRRILTTSGELPRVIEEFRRHA